MGDLRPWQIVVMILAVVVLSGSILWQCSDESKIIKIADSVTVVDVVTGELFRTSLPSQKAVLYPAKNPGTGQMSIFPVEKDGDNWVIPGRFLPQVKDFFTDPKKTGKVDLASGEVSTVNSEPKSASIF